ncbi:MAG: hypothetical protein WBC47_09500, partial [Dehalococcoidia bacterium]
MVKLGYAVVSLILLPLVAIGYIPQSVSVSGGAVDVHYGSLLYLIVSIGTTFFLLSVFILISRYRALTDPQSRNKIVYLLAGLGFAMVFGARMTVPPMPQYPLEHIGHLGNAL